MYVNKVLEQFIEFNHPFESSLEFLCSDLPDLNRGLSENKSEKFWNNLYMYF